MMRLLERLQQKIFLMIGRAVLTALNNTGDIQKVQVKALHGESISEIDRVPEYGFETYPKIDANTEVVIAFQNGNRDSGVVLKIGNKTYRPTDLTEGDTRVYDYRGNKITLKSTGIEAIDITGNTIETTTSGITIKDFTGNEIQMTVLGITLKTGDAGSWLPNILPVDPITGIPHGGPGAGIVKLRGA